MTSITSINWVDFIFINFIIVITILGTLINFIEPYLPVLITQTFRYGKHSHKGVPNRLVQMAELPKSSFRHFYVFALVWSAAWMYLVLHVYVGGYRAPDGVIWLLDTLCGGRGRVARTNPTTTFIAVLLLFVQCVRRCYETHFIQIFSSTSRMNITHYIVGYFHYVGAFLAIMSQANGFVHNEIPSTRIESLSFADCGFVQWMAIGVFLHAWYNQFIANVMLANLRKNKSGAIVTQKHLMPKGGYFDRVSSPHMLFEVVIYVALYVLIHNNSSWLFVLCWVLTNQIENAWLTHKWYVATFPDYPVDRRAIFPMLL